MTQREHIINEATNMFIAEGLKSVRMDDIAVHLKVSKRTLYEMFGDKETLITECVMYNHDRVMEMICGAAHVADNVLEEIMFMLQAWDRHIEDRHKLMINLHKFYPAIYKSIADKEREEGFPLFRGKLEECVRQGLLISGMDFDLTLKLFTGAVQGVMTLGETMFPDGSSRLNILRYTMIFFLRSMTTEKGMKIIDKYLTHRLKI